MKASHAWKEKGTFNIRTKSKDIGGAQSDWSDILEVNSLVQLEGIQNLGENLVMCSLEHQRKY